MKASKQLKAITSTVTKTLLQELKYRGLFKTELGKGYLDPPLWNKIHLAQILPSCEQIRQFLEVKN